MINTRINKVKRKKFFSFKSRKIDRTHKVFLYLTRWKIFADSRSKNTAFFLKYLNRLTVEKDKRNQFCTNFWKWKFLLLLCYCNDTFLENILWKFTYFSTHSSLVKWVHSRGWVDLIKTQIHYCIYLFCYNNRHYLI